MEKSAAERAEEIYADGYDRFRFGGYGEVLASFMDYGINRYRGTMGQKGNTRDHRNEISIPRFVLAFDYKFNSKWILGAEIEFEAGGTGSAYEIETINELEATRFAPSEKETVPLDTREETDGGEADDNQSHSDIIDEITGQMKLFDE